MPDSPDARLDLDEIERNIEQDIEFAETQASHGWPVELDAKAHLADLRRCAALVSAARESVRLADERDRLADENARLRCLLADAIDFAECCVFDRIEKVEGRPVNKSDLLAALRAALSPETKGDEG